MLWAGLKGVKKSGPAYTGPQHGKITEHSYKSPFLFHMQQIKNHEQIHNSGNSRRNDGTGCAEVAANSDVLAVWLFGGGNYEKRIKIA